MKTRILRRALVRLRKASLCLPALALALALGAVVVTPPPDTTTTPVSRPIAIPLVNWNS